MLSVTHIMPVLMLLSVMGVGMQQRRTQNQNEMHTISTSPTFSKIPYISLTAVRFPDISMVSRQVVSPYHCNTR